jgi:hypothetical protein
LGKLPTCDWFALPVIDDTHGYWSVFDVTGQVIATNMDEDTALFLATIRNTAGNLLDTVDLGNNLPEAYVKEVYPYERTSRD